MSGVLDDVVMSRKSADQRMMQTNVKVPIGVSLAVGSVPIKTSARTGERFGR